MTSCARRARSPRSTQGIHSENACRFSSTPFFLISFFVLPVFLFILFFALVYMLFTELGLSDPILLAIKEHGYTTPTPIQSQSIPAVLKGGDLLAAAQTGTGKTAGFTLPILQRLITAAPPAAGARRVIRALILTPTRELAAQVHESVMTYGKYT